MPHHGVGLETLAGQRIVNDRLRQFVREVLEDRAHERVAIPDVAPDQRKMHIGRGRDVTQRDRVNPAKRKQPGRRVKYRPANLVRTPRGPRRPPRSRRTSFWLAHPGNHPPIVSARIDQALVRPPENGDVRRALSSAIRGPGRRWSYQAGCPRRPRPGSPAETRGKVYADANPLTPPGREPCSHVPGYHPARVKTPPTGRSYARGDATARLRKGEKCPRA